MDFLENFFHKNDFAITHADGFGKRGASIPADSSGKPAGCAASEDLERIAGIGPKQNERENGNENE
jgi:predicted flap endonuclease-1-like 5' DNA nuclease